MSKRDLPKWLTKTPIAHRGLHDIAKGVPENSLLAFQKAIEGDYAIELDVRLTGDGQVVVFHDPDLRRLCGREGIVAQIPLAELKELTLLGTQEKVPSFRDVLDMVKGRVPLVVEIKKEKGEPAGILDASVARMLQHYPGPFVVQSFNPRTVKWFQKNAPQIVRGQISTDLANMTKGLSWFSRLQLKRALMTGYGEPDFLAYDVRDLPSEITAAARRRGLPILSWTVRTPAERARAAAHADNIIFEELSTN
ncbi:glycerophosphodiester phosphodiesterase [uncultured Ferrovibrio sp.]|jgi:glycerophosphoryl diester phosphodiesterase|uniref:glycerophosphodiester phosphodiesterase n=1 Tax=uncultured Ferrovibrio sp. TaxID=1576913 RepID=UPI0026094711|nr:glycerophosphodiester phosphodiesterase [uncultured Ferrovibrio sp.]